MRFQLVPHVLKEAQPLIYMWEIRRSDGSLVGRYVGKAKAGARRPLKHYARNVANILSGKPYRNAVEHQHVQAMNCIGAEPWQLNG